jgi:CheY-like chemotaxis protein
MIGRLRAYVVDDEPGALKQVVQSLKSTGRVDVVGTATSAETALIEIPELDPEALFLDIHMPGMTGFELLQRLTVSPLVVFVTAFDEYTLQAFEVHAIDYLGKPQAGERVERTLERLRKPARRDPQRAAGVQAVLERLARHYRDAAYRPMPTASASTSAGSARSSWRPPGITHFVAQESATLAMRRRRAAIRGSSASASSRSGWTRGNSFASTGAPPSTRACRQARPELGGRLVVRLKDAAQTEPAARDRARTFKERLRCSTSRPTLDLVEYPQPGSRHC